MNRAVAGVATLVLVAGCRGGGGTTPPRCVAGDSKACAGPGACSGYQVCRADGTFGACVCGAGGSGGVVGNGGAGGSGGASGAGGQTCGVVAGRGGGGAPAGGTGGIANPDAGRDAYVSDGRAADPQFQTFCAAARATMVARNERCLSLSQEQAEAWVNIDPCAAWGSAMDRGLMAFDGTNADACIGALQTLSCGVDSPPAACGGVIRGLVPNPGVDAGTGACNPGRQLSVSGDPLPSSTLAVKQVPLTNALYTECLPGSFCAPTQGAFACQPFPQIGGACSNGPAGGCAAGICDSGGHCAAPKQIGESCTGDADCAQGTYCGAGSICAAKRTSGACASSAECLLPATCQSGNCRAAHVGDACVHACSGPSIDICWFGMYCAPDSTCHRSPIAGQACSYVIGDLFLCFIGQCDTTAGPAGTCRLQAANSACGGEAPTSASCGANAICRYNAPGFAGNLCAPAWN